MTAHTNPARPAETDAPFFREVAVTIKMTPDQREDYGEEYGIALTAVRAEINERLPDIIRDALGGSPNPLLRDFCTYSVSEPR